MLTKSGFFRPTPKQSSRFPDTRARTKTKETRMKNSVVRAAVVLSACIVTLAAAGLSAKPAQAQTWPGQTIKIVVPFTPGTGMDTIARTVSPRLSERLGQSVVVQNTPGASGNIGADNVAKSSADGYTVLMGANTMLMASQLYKNVPFDPVSDFSAVSMAAYGTLMLVSNPKTGIKTMADLVAQAKAKPGSLTYGSPGIGTPHHMAMELFKTQTGLFMLHVPYRGTSGYVQDLLSGELMAGFLPVHVAQGFVAAGKLNALAVGGMVRHPVAPGVATIDELGVKGVNVDMWYGFFVPGKTPAPVVSRLNTELAAVLNLPEVRSVFAKAGLDAASSSPAELADVVKKDYQRWGTVIKRNSITAE
jgi:tripartite-type tricarboxylate transporter receptor subunit TctC